MPSKELKKKIGQLFICGFEGRAITAGVKNLLGRYHVGGLVFFARNISEPGQVWELIRSLKNPGLITAIDHEGGRVVRLPEPVTRFPAAARFGEVNAPALVRSAAAYQARELKAIGFNFNFAPVLDLNTNPLNRVIADRAYSADPARVSTLAVEYIHGFRDEGVIACGKHFPGHGDTREDSHEVLPRVKAGVAELLGRELVPFKAAIDAGVPSIMTAHVVYEGTGEKRPATLSRTLLEDVLRKRLGFTGAVVSDDLEMSGIADNYDVEDRTILALNAGVDLLMFCHSLDVQVQAIETVYRAVDGRIVSEQRIEEAYSRVMELKRAAAAGRTAANRGELYSVLNNSQHKSLAASLS